MNDTALIERAAEKIKAAKSALFLTGAGMSADSGLPTYRDKCGFWRNFPVYKKLKISPQSLSTPYAFSVKAEYAWRFKEWFRRKAFEKELHEGYHIINRWIREEFERSFVHTMNVDGYHIRSGTPPEMVREVHGSLWRVQCTGRQCKRPVTENHEVPWLDLDFDTMKVRGVPTCELCGNPLRPNVRLFGDRDYQDNRWQLAYFERFVKERIDIVFLIGSSAKISTNEHYFMRPFATIDVQLISQCKCKRE